jgi:PAS domain S-box-containing protein
LGSIKTLSESVSSFARGDMQGRVHLETHDELGQIGGSFNKMADELTELIQARQKSQHALQESEEKFRHLFEDAADPVLLLKNGRFVDCNTATLKLLRYGSKEAFLNCSPHSISPIYQPDGRTSAEKSAEMDAAALREGFNRFEWVHTRFDGSTTPVEVTLTRIRVEGELILHVHWRDITERKHNEAQIERLSRVYRLLSRVNEAIVRTRDRNELFTTICNSAVESGLFQFVWIGMLDDAWVIPVAHAGKEDGYLLCQFNIVLDDEHTGKGPTGRAIREGTHIICHDIENDPCMTPWRNEALNRGYRASAAFPIYEKNGDAGAINVYAAEPHFFTPDIIQLMQELAADVSFALGVFAEKARRESVEGEIKLLNLKLESRVLERTSQLEIVNNELESFSYSVSHDLRAPLRSIDGFSQILLKKYHDQLDENGKDCLGRVCRASQRMGQLIDDMLQLSQVTRGALKRGLVDLSRIAAEVADELRNAHPERKVQFILQQGLTAYGDPGLLRIVMDNLLGNAWKYTGKKSGAEIEFGMCDINPDDPSGVGLGAQCTFFVRDNGTGFNMEYAHKLFGAFQRLHGVDEFEGTGVGLATVQRIIHRHQGKVWAEAAEGRGATFYFALPQRERTDSGGN